MADPALLSPPLRDARGLAFLQLCEGASAVDLAQTRISWFDQAPSAALPALAVQAGLSTDPGWLLATSTATSDGERRALLKESLSLAKRRGTPWSIQRALALSGWPGLRFQERLPPRTLDGTWILDGVVGLDQLANWARFRVVQPLPDKPVTPEALALIVRVIEAWKPLRCHLEGIAFTLQLASSLHGGLLDGSWPLDGSRTLCGIRLEEIAEVRFGAGGLSAGLAHRLAIPAVDDSQAGWVSVRFEIDALTANDEQIDTFALCAAQGAEITRLTRAPITKTPGLVLDCTWVISTNGGDTKGRIP